MVPYRGSCGVAPMGSGGLGVYGGIPYGVKGGLGTPRDVPYRVKGRWGPQGRPL